MKNSIVQYAINKKRKQVGKRGRMFTAAAGALMLGAMSLLTACSSGTSSGTQSGTGAASQSVESGAPGGQAAKGRYMEEEIALPEEIAENGYVGVVQKKDKSLLFAIPDEEGNDRFYSYDAASSWTKGEAIAPLDNIRPAKMFMDQNEKLYFGGFDQENYTFHLWMVQEDGTVQELFPEVFKIQEGRSYGVIPDFIGIGPGGEILVSESSEANVYLPDGKKSVTLAQDFIGLDVRIPACLTGDEYVTMSNQQLVRYNITTGRITERYNMPENGSGSNMMIGQMPVFTDEEGGIYVADATGLYHIGRNGTLWEQLIDGSLNSMGRQDMYLMKFFQGTDNDFYGIYSTSNSRMKLIHYYYDETVDTVPPETLTVYSLKDSYTVRQAAAILQKNNPQIKVDYRIAVEDEYGKVTEDVIRALNTELLNGKGADVLILDGLPMETYKNKGILADLSSLFEKDKDDYLPNVRGGFTGEDGKIYYMPARIKVPVIYGGEDAVAAFQDPELMAAYDKTPTLFAPDIYENILNMTAYTCFNKLFNDNGTVDGDALTRWLTGVKSAGEKGNVQVSYDQADMDRLKVNNTVIPYGFGRQSDFNLASGRCAAAAEILDSIDSAMLPLSAAEINGSSFESIGGIYIPSVVAGINASTGNKENAEEFLRVLFGTEVQDESLRDGFSVRSSSLDKWSGMEKSVSVSMSMGGEGIALEGEWPKQADRDMILAIVRTVSVPAIVETQIIDMIVDGSRDYLSGKGTIENAVQTIESKMKLYVNERE